MARQAATISRATAGRSPTSTPCVWVSESSTEPLGSGSTIIKPMATAARISANSLRRVRIGPDTWRYGSCFRSPSTHFASAAKSALCPTPIQPNYLLCMPNLRSQHGLSNKHSHRTAVMQFSANSERCHRRKLPLTGTSGHPQFKRTAPKSLPRSMIYPDVSDSGFLSLHIAQTAVFLACTCCQVNL